MVKEAFPTHQPQLGPPVERFGELVPFFLVSILGGDPSQKKVGARALLGGLDRDQCLKTPNQLYNSWYSLATHTLFFLQPSKNEQKKTKSKKHKTNHAKTSEE